MDTRSASSALKGTLIVAVLAAFAAIKFIGARTDPQGSATPLAIKWEGVAVDRNFRDAGASLNDCLGRTLFRVDSVYRANVWFSGWSCAGVGSPDVVYSLNYDPTRHEQYFCEGQNGRIVGRHFNTKRLNDLEFLETWNDADMAAGACGFLKDGLESLAAGKRLLVHCDAGKDRTGTFVAILAALAAESQGDMNADFLNGVECDYRRSKTLEPAKYGRMKTFIESLQVSGGVAHFLEARCAIDQATIDAAAARLLAERS